MKHLLFFILLSYNFSASSQNCTKIKKDHTSSINKISSNETKKLDSLFDALAANNKAIGSFALRQNGKLVYSKATGFILDTAELNTAKPSTIYCIGSITKMYIAAIVFKLIEKGKLNMGTPLSTFYPSIPNASKIYIRQMLGHKRGLFNVTADSSYEQWCYNPLSKSEMVGKLQMHPPVFEPGTKTQYRKSNYILLGYIIEKITNKTYNQNLAAYINKVTGAKNTSFVGKKTAKGNQTASFSFKNKIWVKQKVTNMSIPHGAGAISATADDVALFAEQYINGQILNSAWTDTVLNVPRQLGYGIIKFNVEGETGYGHNGAIDGFNSEVTYFPQQKVSICFLSNGIKYSIDEIMRAAFCISQQKPYTIPSFKTVTLSNEELQKFDGEYSSDKIALKITASHKEGILYIKPTGQPLFAMEAESDTSFNNGQIGVGLEFILNTSNTIKEMLLKQGGAVLTFKK